MTDENHWVEIIERTRVEMQEAPTDRDALVIAFTELARLILEIKYGEKVPG